MHALRYINCIPTSSFTTFGTPNTSKSEIPQSKVNMNDREEDNSTMEVNQKCAAKSTQDYAEISGTPATTESSTIEPRQRPGPAAAIPSTVTDTSVDDALSKLGELGIQEMTSSAIPAYTTTDGGRAEDRMNGDIQVERS